MAAKKTETIVEIKPIKLETVRIDIVGDSPLIVHAWSEKAKRMILDKQMKTATSSGREAKNPVEDFINSMYWLTEKPTRFTEDAFADAISKGARFGFPVTGIKQSAISGAFRTGVAKDKVSLRGAFFITGVGTDDPQMAEIISNIPEMREDTVRVGMGTADIRYRGEFSNWRIRLNLTYNANGQYSLDQILTMLNLGGFAVGLGEWRPEHDGQYGMYHIETAE